MWRQGRGYAQVLYTGSPLVLPPTGKDGGISALREPARTQDRQALFFTGWGNTLECLASVENASQVESRSRGHQRLAITRRAEPGKDTEKGLGIPARQSEAAETDGANHRVLHGRRRRRLGTFRWPVLRHGCRFSDRPFLLRGRDPARIFRRCDGNSGYRTQGAVRSGKGKRTKLSVQGYTLGMHAGGPGGRGALGIG